MTGDVGLHYDETLVNDTGDIKVVVNVNVTGVVVNNIGGCRPAVVSDTQGCRPLS